MNFFDDDPFLQIFGQEKADRLFSRIDAHITRRINEFHDALQERGQISPCPRGYGGRAILDCTQDDDAQLDRAERLIEPAVPLQRAKDTH